MALLLSLGSQAGHARDDGRYANSPLKEWFVLQPERLRAQAELDLSGDAIAARLQAALQ